VGVRAELAAGDLRPLYLAWLAAFGTWERDEDASGYHEENDLEPPVPAGLGTLTAPQRALADFLRLGTGLLTIAAEASPPLAETKDDPASWPNGSRTCPSATRTHSSSGSPKAMAPRSRWNCGAGSAVIPVPPATAAPAAPSPNCWTQPPKHAPSNMQDAHVTAAFVCGAPRISSPVMTGMYARGDSLLGHK